MGGEQPTEFGQWLLDQMYARTPPLSRAALAALVGVPSSTISRWILRPGKPQTEKLAQLAEVLGVDYGEVLVRAGHGRPADQEVDTGPRPLTHPKAREIDRMLNPNSPLTDKDREWIENLLDMAIDLYQTGRRKRAG